MRRSYLVVSENAEARETLAILLRSQGLTVTSASGVADALRVLRSTPVDTCLVVAHGPAVTSEKLRTHIHQERPDARVLVLTRSTSIRNQKRILRFGIGDYHLSERELIGLLSASHGVEADEGVVPDKGVRSLVEVVDVLVGLLELGDRHFVGSSHRAAQLARCVLEQMGLPEDIAVEITLATLLRDIGKYGIEDSVMKERGNLSDEQTRRMRDHVSGGVRLLEHIEFPWKIVAVIRHHHERYDGLGYPDGLRGPEIPLGARILAVVDAYVAMLSDRPHRPSLSSEQALSELERGAGFQFDPEVVEVFMRVVQETRAILRPDVRPRILVADRDADFVRLLKMRLHNDGMEVETETNIQDALLRMIDSPPHLILAEVDTDESRSFEFLNVLREDDALGRVPFAFLVPRFDLNLNVRVLRQGVDDCLVKTDDLEMLVARIKNILIRETRRGPKDDSPRRRGITGQLENLSLPDIVQIIHMGVKTACLSLSGTSEPGRIWFDSGNAVHAEVGSLQGSDAFYEMLRWKQGEFCIAHGLKTDDRSIETDTMYLVMEGLRLIDEGAAATVPAD